MDSTKAIADAVQICNRDVGKLGILARTNRESKFQSRLLEVLASAKNNVFIPLDNG